MERVNVIVAAAGSGERLGRGDPKAFVDLAGRPLVSFALETARRLPGLERVVVAVPSDRIDLMRSIAPDVDVVEGAATRHGTIARALERIDPTAHVVCHDAARPFATVELFSRVVDALERWDGAIPGLPVTDTVKRVDGERVLATEPRERLVLSQTPQAFRGGVLVESHRRAALDGRSFTDDAACLEWAGFTVGVVPGEPGNVKITTDADLRSAEVDLAVRRG